MTSQSRSPLGLVPLACHDDLRFINVNTRALTILEYSLTWPDTVSHDEENAEFEVLDLIPAKIVAYNLICNLVPFHLQVRSLNENVSDVELP